MIKLDLHTHSQASPDGSLSPAQYRRMLESGRLDYIAVTDHDTAAFALELKADLPAELAARIIVGEEIMTRDGELIGLFIGQTIPRGMSAARTATAIHAQGGLVYVPHPLETVRRGLPLAVLDALAPQIDVVETANGRAVFGSKNAEAAAWAAENRRATAAASDAHGWHGWGKTYCVLPAAPTRGNLAALLQSADARLVHQPMGVRGLLYPKFNRLRKVTRYGA